LTSDTQTTPVSAGPSLAPGALIKSSVHNFLSDRTNKHVQAEPPSSSNGTLYAAAPGFAARLQRRPPDGRQRSTLAIQTTTARRVFTADAIRDLNANAHFLAKDAMLSIDTAPAGLTVPSNLTGLMGLAVQGTNTLTLGGINTNLGNIAIYSGQLTLSASNNQQSGTCSLEGTSSSNAVLRLTSGASLAGSGDFSISQQRRTLHGGGDLRASDPAKVWRTIAFGQQRRIRLSQHSAAH
jgi:hypothetical protein